MHNSCEGGIEKSVPRDHRLSSLGKPDVMPNGDPRDGFFYPTLTLMIDSYISPTVCGPGLFRCDDGKCISDRERCDTYRDCSDGADEINCGKLHTGKCIRRFGGIYAYCRYFIDRKW